MTPVREPWIITPTALMSTDGSAVRTPPRAPEDREPGYAEKYDDTTVFYDVFRCGRRVLAVGPPAGTLRSEIEAVKVRAARGPSTSFRIDRGLDRVGRFWTRAISPSTEQTLEVHSRLSTSPLRVGDDLAAAFRGSRAAMTVSKDNDLTWVRDWGRWHARYHGADALVVYDNNSTAYSLEELWETLAGIAGVVTAAVVAWPFKYGPVTRLQRHWDSDYAQRGAIEHARWRLLRDAAGFLNADIDELVLDVNGRSVFDVATAIRSGVVELPGRYTYPDPGTPRGERPVHAESFWVKTFPPEMPSAPKWCVVPSRVPRAAQLSVHNVRGVRMTQVEGLRFAHLLKISTDWYGARSDFHVVPEQYEIDEAVLAHHEGRAPLEGAADSGVARMSWRRTLAHHVLGWAWRWKLRLGSR